MKKYQHTVEPIDATEKDGKTIVTARVAGNFPGSPVNLQYTFRLDGDRSPRLRSGDERHARGPRSYSQPHVNRWIAAPFP